MIRILSKSVADKIAAGEVVDRPLSVIKELVENAVDAGADTVTVEIKNGGKTYLRVTDNGCGIPHEEAELAFLRHATSKIVSDRDLESIKTLGFRGEALASIAAVSRTEMMTKIKESKVGTLLRLEGGEQTEVRSIGCPDGTTITVTDLFFNTPARLKFMKGEGTERTLIIEFLSKAALAYPFVKFTVINNGNILFATNGNGDIYRNILAIYGNEIGKQLVPVEKHAEHGTIKGYVSNPAFSQNNRKNQIFFVNGRSIRSKVIEKGLDAAYTERLFNGRFPVAFLFLELPPERLDVNIHPNKLEVRFDDELAVYELVHSAVREALATGNAIPQMRAKNIFKASATKVADESQASAKEPAEGQSARIAPAAASEDDNGSTMRFSEESAEKADTVSDSQTQLEVVQLQTPVIGNTSEIIDVSEPRVDIKSLLSTLRAEQQAQEQISFAEAPQAYRTEPAEGRPDIASLRPMGIIFGTYIIAVAGDTLYLFDQHAAHERVFFEQLQKQYLTQEKLTQPLLMPVVLHVSYTEKSQENQWLEELRAMGFDIEEFGPNAYTVRGIPLFTDLSEAEDFARYFIERAGEMKGPFDKSKTEKLAMAACKKAVKANDKLSPEEATALFAQLSACENPYSCPHGRPTFVRITKNEIEKLFKRI